MRVGIIIFGNGSIIDPGEGRPKSILSADEAKDPDDDTKLLGITNNMEKLRKAVDELRPSQGFTNMAQAFIKAKNMFEGVQPHPTATAQQTLIVITDGLPSFKYITNKSIQK
jgi:Mg-chelatase subunit ChlD